MALDHKDLPDDAEELVAEYLGVSRELREIESNPQLIDDKISAILETVPRLKAIEEGTYGPSDEEIGVDVNAIFDPDDNKFLGWHLVLKTASERFAENEIKKLNSKKYVLKNRLDLLRVKAASLGITLPEEQDKLVGKDPDPDQKSKRKIKDPPESVIERRHAVQECYELNRKTLGRKLNRLTCDYLDKKNIKILPRWKGKYQVTKWKQAFRHNKKLKNGIEKMFCSDRKK